MKLLSTEEIYGFSRSTKQFSNTKPLSSSATTITATITAAAATTANTLFILLYFSYYPQVKAIYRKTDFIFDNNKTKQKKKNRNKKEKQEKKVHRK